MAAIEIRPRFQKQVGLNQEETLQRLKRALDQPGTDIIGMVADHHVVLKFPQAQQHYWSPQLALEVEPAEDGVLIRGLFGPRPSLWLMFMFIYAILGTISLFIAIIGFSRISLGLSAPILWVLPAAAGLGLFLFFSAKTGERLGHDEMIRLQNFMDDALGSPTGTLAREALETTNDENHT